MAEIAKQTLLVQEQNNKYFYKKKHFMNFLLKLEKEWNVNYWICWLKRIKSCSYISNREGRQQLQKRSEVAKKNCSYFFISFSFFFAAFGTYQAIFFPCVRRTKVLPWQKNLLVTSLIDWGTCSWGAPFTSLWSCPSKWQPLIYSRSPTFKLLDPQELELVTGAHPALWKQQGF